MKDLEPNDSETLVPHTIWPSFVLIPNTFPKIKNINRAPANRFDIPGAVVATIIFLNPNLSFVISSCN